VQKNFFRLLLALPIFSLVVWSCNKIDTTNIGADLLPAGDNVETLADTLTVVGTQGVLSPDSTRIGTGDYQVLGSISNDPLFGTTNANIYFQYKPTFFPYYFGNANDSIGQPYAPSGTGYDSVVLCLSYKGFYGDSTQPQHLRIYQIEDNEPNFKYDTVYTSLYQPFIKPTKLLGEATVIPADLKNQILYNYGKDSSSFQIRIKLDNSYLNKILANNDSSAFETFHSDSLFNMVFKGLAVEADGGSAAKGLFYISLTDANTRLEVHYRSKNKTPIDTTYSSWYVNSTSSVSVKKSSSANYIDRNRTGSEYESSHPQELFLQTTPGTYATLKIPDLSIFQNSIIHRAELQIIQVPPASPYLPVPNNLYLDALDTGSTEKYIPLPYDLSPYAFYDPYNSLVGAFFPSAGIDYSHYGGGRQQKTDPLTGLPISFYTFNISRYIQHIVTNHNTNYTLRLSAPYKLYYYGYSFTYPNSLAYGAIKVGNGNNPNYRLILRIVYSKI
jgi:hypothetical protein